MFVHIIFSGLCILLATGTVGRDKLCLFDAGKVPRLEPAFLWSLDLVTNRPAGLVQASTSGLGLLSKVGLGGAQLMGGWGPPLLSPWIFGPPG